MGFLDFLFGKKKDDEPRRSQQTATSTQTSSSQRQSAPASSSRPSNNTVTEKTIEPFVFKSNCHQRYQNGSEVMGLQQCIRTVRVEKNTNGCSGYRLSSGDGYIVKIYNDDLGKPNMSDKPMRIVSKTSTKVELRGFPIEAQTPFGWQEVDYRDYGFTIYYTNGKVSKCVLHMFDRNVDLEYRQTAAQSESSNGSMLDSLALKANTTANNSKNEAQNIAYNLMQSIFKNPAEIRNIRNVEAVAIALGRLLEGEYFTDNDSICKAVSITYYLLSKAINSGCKSPYLYVYRFSTAWEYNKVFYHLFAHAEGKEYENNPFDILSHTSTAVYDHHLQGMQMADALTEPKLLQIDAALGNIFYEMYNRYRTTPKQQIIDLGNKYHKTVFDYLSSKVNALDFDF
jgi:hypothetical protein